MDNIRIVRILEKLSFKLKSCAIYFELKHYVVKKEKHLIKIYRWNRNIGKTYNLVKIALKYNLPIFVPNDTAARYITGTAVQYFWNKLEKRKGLQIIIAQECVKGRRFNVALVEEGIKTDILNNIVIPMCSCIVGYESVYPI